jgi:hypothetical protein
MIESLRVLLIAILSFTVYALGGAFCRADSMPPGALNAKDYGVKADGTTNDVAALNTAIAAAIAKGPGTVLFLPAGTYALGERTLLVPGLKRDSMLNIAHADGLTIEGEPGTLLVCRDLMETIFDIEQSHKVTLRNMAFDADPLPYTQGTITAYDPATHSVDIQVDHGFDDIDRDDLAKMTQFRFFDNPYTTGWREDTNYPDMGNRVKLGPGKWRVSPLMAHQYDGFAPSLVGKAWMLWSRGYKGWTVHIGKSDDCLVENLMIYQAGGSAAFELLNNGDVTIRHDYIGPPAHSNRRFSGGGGAMSFFNRGTVTVEDCDFSQIDDDGFNLGTHYVRVVEKVDPQTCRTEVWPGEFVVGDTVVLWDWKTKVERGTAKLTDAKKEKDGHWLLHFDQPLDFETVGEGNLAASHKAQAQDGIDRVTDLESAGTSILRGNKISSMRARCFLVKTGHSIIENNYFHDTHMPAIIAGPEFFWGEAPELRGLIIRHNTFCNVDAPNISIATFDSPTGMANKDVTIEDNTFLDYGRFPVVYLPHDPNGVVIQVRNTDGLKILNNTIEPPAEGTPKINPILIETCTNVVINPQPPVQ